VSHLPSPYPVPAKQGSSLLDPLESTSQSGPNGVSSQDFHQQWGFWAHCEDGTFPEQSFRHSGWQQTRAIVSDALLDVHGDGVRFQRFWACGRHAYVVRDPEAKHRYRVVADYCHDRFCLPCGQARSRVISGNLSPLIADEPHRFITLTLRTDDEPLLPLLHHLYTSFGKLKRTQLWRETITGGAAFVEVKWSEAKQRWHPHLHLVCAGRYLPKSDLSREWLRITRTSFIVDVRLIRDHDRTVDYICKYASKPLDQTVLRHPDRLREMMKALHGRKLCMTFGDWTGTSLTASTETTEWVEVCSLEELIRGVEHGKREAIQILRVLRSRYRWLPRPPSDPSLWDQ